MTLIMVWKESQAERLWVVSDSRLSLSGAVGTVRLTDRGAKILEVPAVLQRPTPLQVFGTPVKTTTLGFAFSGSTLVALQAYAAVLPLWCRLQTTGAEILPPISDFAKHLAVFVQAYASEVASAQGQVPSCYCALVGWSEAEAALDGYGLEVQCDGGLILVDVQRLGIFTPGSIHTFGSGGSQAMKDLLAELDEKGADNVRREPLKFIRKFVKTDQHEAVGGGIQIGWATCAGFQIAFDAQPLVVGQPFADMRYRGFEFSAISQVGQAFVTLPGLA